MPNATAAVPAAATFTDAESTFQGRPDERGAGTQASEQAQAGWTGDIEGQRLFALVRSRMFARSGALRVGRYRIVRRLGAGAMGEVQLAIDEQLDRAVAVKFVHPHLAHPRFTERLRVEARALARLAHTNVVHVYEVGEQHGRVFLAMEYINGQSLRDWIAQAPGWEQVLRAYLEAARGLAAAHSAGVIHRDFKPDNVLRGAQGRVAVADFGLAALERQTTTGREDLGSTIAPRPTMKPSPTSSATGPGARARVEGELDQDLDTATLDIDSGPDAAGPSIVSRTGEVKGTPAYMPPEQFRGQSDARADQFALCVALYEGLWGQRPFARRTIEQMLRGDVDWRPLTPPARRPGQARVPKWIWPLIRRGLAVEPDDRWETIDELIVAFERGLGRRRRRARLIGSGVVALAVGVISGASVAWWGEDASVEDCSSVARELADTWDRDQRAQLGQVLTSAAGSAGATWLVDSEAPIVAGLDRWRDRWIESRAELCRGRAGGDPIVLDRLGACLERHHRSTQALVELMLAGDLQTLREAPRAVLRLNNPRACASEARQGGPPEPPNAIAAAVEQVRRELSEIDAERMIAHHETALVRIEQLAARVAALEYLPLSAELAHARGHALLSAARAEGLEALEQAADLGEAARHDRVVADSWRLMATFAATTHADLESGRRWLRRADAAAARVGGARRDPLGIARLDYVRGNLELLDKNFVAANNLLEPLLAVFEDDPDHQDLLFAAHSATALGLAVLNMGSRDRAIELFGRSLGLLERVHGQRHPDVAQAAYNLGQLSLEAGDTELAQTMLERAVQIWAHADELELRNTGRAQLVLGQLALARGRNEAALEHALAAATAFERAPEMQIEQAEAASLVGAAHYFLAQPEPAVVAYRRAIQGYADAYGADDVYVAYFRVGLGWALLAAGQVDDARVEFESALGVIEAKGGGAEQVVDASFGLISVDIASAQLASARARLVQFDAQQLAGMERLEFELFAGLLALRGGGDEPTDRTAGAASLASAHARAKTVVSGEATLAILLTSLDATDEERGLAGE